MTRILYSILFVALLAQTSAAASYTFTSTYTSTEDPGFPGIGGVQTVTIQGTFDFTGSFLGPATNLQFTSFDVPSGLNVGSNYFVGSAFFAPGSTSLIFSAVELSFPPPSPPFISSIANNRIGVQLGSGLPDEVFGRTVVQPVVEPVPVPSSIAMLGMLAATVGCGTWMKRRRKV